MSKYYFPEIKSGRFSLRKLRLSDWKMISYLRSDKTVNKYVERPSAESKAEAFDFIKRINHNNDLQNSYYWCISNNNDSKMIGSICLWNFSEDRKTAEVGYDLHPEFQGKGIMNEALSLVLNFGFNNLNLEKIKAFTHRDNDSSRRLLNKNNFILIPGKTDKNNENNVIYEIQKIIS